MYIMNSYSRAKYIILENNSSVILYTSFLQAETASYLMESIINTSAKWQVEGNRKTAWSGEKSYSYSGKTLHRNTMHSDIVSILLDKMNSALGEKFNSILCNLYENGKCSLGWHSDDEVELGSSPTIASLSLGGERTFQLKNKNTASIHTVKLLSGSLLIMSGDTQLNYLHRVPPEKSVSKRLNITFRKIF